MFVQGILLYFLYLIIIVYSLQSNGSLIENFYHFSINSTANLKVLQKESVIIRCPISCHNCTEPALTWYYHGHLIEPGDNILNDNGFSYHIESFNTDKHSGDYSCVLSAEGLSMHSGNISVQASDFPPFLIEDQQSYLNGIAVFTCHDVSKLHSSQYNINWYRDGQPIKENSRVKILDGLLLLENISLSDAASYHCQLFKLGYDFAKKSTVHSLHIHKAEKLSPSIQYVTQDKEVLYNTRFTIFCSTKGLTNAVISLYKRSSDGKQEFKLKQSFNYIDKEEIALENAVYVCEAEHGNVRSKEEISIIVYGIPHIISNHALYIQQYLGRDVSFGCVLTGNPTPTVSWYHNSRRISTGLSANGTWLTIKRLVAKDSGIYQCIAENNVGTVTKYSYLSLTISGLAPRNFEAKVLSPTQFSASWNKPRDLDETKSHFYRLIWTRPFGVDNYLDTNDTNCSVVNQGVYGGMTYTIKLCFVSTLSDSQINDCVFSTLTMPETVPSKGPDLNKPMQIREQFFDVTWKPLPAEYAMGKIEKYKIYCEVLDGQYRGQLEIFLHVEPKKTSSAIHLSKKGIYKIWMTAFTSVGESPKSNGLIVDSGTLDPFDNVANLQVEWKDSTVIGSKPSAVLKWHIDALITSNKYKLYYVRIPYNNYWKEVHAFTISNGSQSFILNNLDTEAKYRFTLIPVKRVLKLKDEGVLNFRKKVADNDVKSLGRTSSVYLLPKSIKNVNENEKTVSAPQSLECHNIDEENHLVLSWKSIEPKYKVSQYKVRLFSDLNDVEIVYITHRTSIQLRNLTKGFWYGVQVEGYGSLSDVVYQRSPYKSCRTKEKVPTAVRDVKYKFVYSKAEEMAFLHLSWLPPQYTGASTYSYEIVRRANNKGSPFPFPPEFGHLIMEKQSDDRRIHYKAMWTEIAVSSQVRHNVTIVAINDVGIGAYFEMLTYYIMHPSNLKPNPQTVAPSTSSDTRMGLVVGVSISVIFLLVFVVICAVKEPWKKDTENSILTNVMHDDYLYAQKLEEMQTVSIDSSQCSSGVSIRKSNKLKKRWKFFRLFRPLYASYQPANSSDLSNTILYSSGSSSSGGSRVVHGGIRSKCDSQQLSSCSGLHSSSDFNVMSEGKITFISDTACT